MYKSRVRHEYTFGFALSEGRGDLSQHLVPSSAAREIGDGDLRVGVKVIEQLQVERRGAAQKRGREQ